MDEMPKQENNGSKRPISYEKRCKISFIFGCILGIFALAGNIGMSYFIFSTVATRSDLPFTIFITNVCSLICGIFSILVSMGAMAFTYNGIKRHKIISSIVISILAAGSLSVLVALVYALIV